MIALGQCKLCINICKISGDDAEKIIKHLANVNNARENHRPDYAS